MNKSEELRNIHDKRRRSAHENETPLSLDQRTPIGIRLLAIFFVFGAGMCLLTIVLLLFPGTALDSLWRLNPDAHAAFQSLGKLSIAMMAVLGAACAAAAIGLTKNCRWGRNLAVIILAVNVGGDLINVLARGEVRALIGVPIAAAMIVYLLRARVEAR
jgi:uncharacterized membrane protein (DUF2068 family)